MINTRAEAIFDAIKRNVDLVDAEVLDLGCGYGDLATASLVHGAHQVTIVDKNPNMIVMAEAKIVQRAPIGSVWETMVIDIDDRSQLAALKYYHVAICTSVLPYLSNKDMVLSFLASRAEVSIIEMQYFGDGPGPVAIKDDSDMLAWISGFWPKVEKIGQSYTGREIGFRSIWKCESGGGEWEENQRSELNR